MSTNDPSTVARHGWRGRVRVWANLLGLRPGEVLEVLERLPFGAVDTSRAPEAWDRPAALRALEIYAARKRAVTRLSRQGRL